MVGATADLGAGAETRRPLHLAEPVRSHDFRLSSATLRQHTHARHCGFRACGADLLGILSAAADSARAEDRSRLGGAARR